MSDRQGLRERQAEVVRALVGGGPAPAGFDAHRLALTRQALMRKRARGVAAHWPALGAQPHFTERFAEWAAGRPPAPAHGEGLEFARWLGPELCPAARVELVLAGHRRFARDTTGLVVRLPLLGARRLSLRRR